MLTKYHGIDQTQLKHVVLISNRYRNHYKRGQLKLTQEDIMKKPRPWIRLLPLLNERI